MSTDTAPKYPHEHQELAATVAATLMDGGVAPAAARALAEEVKERLRRVVWGGQKIYFPSTKYTVEHMREEIARRWDGTNTRELCREFEISESRLRALADEGRRPRSAARTA